MFDLFTSFTYVVSGLMAVVLFLLSGLLPQGYGSNVKVAIAQATNILRLAVFLGVIGAGQTLVINSGYEGIDLSAGSVVTLTAILTYVIVKGEDGREVLKIIYAAYQSAGEGRKIEWPYTPPAVKKPIDLWKK